MENTQTLRTHDQTGNLNYQIYDEPRSEDGKRVSESLYWEKYYEHPDFSYEWNRGYLEEKPVSDLMNVEAGRWFLRVLEAFLETYPLAKITQWEFGFRLALPGRTTIRRPDIGVALNDNPDGLGPDDRTFSGVFDLCVEIISDSAPEEVRRDTVHKKREYGGIGVREYYILDARGRHTAFWHLAKGGFYRVIRPDSRGVIRSGVLPGFQFRESDLILQPSLREMSEDGVYRDFVLPYYQAEKLRAEKAEKVALEEKLRAEKAEKAAQKERLRAEKAEEVAQTERQRAEEAEQRAEYLAAKLSELGISLE